jgi:putative ABC transport system permease protein
MLRFFEIILSSFKMAMEEFRSNKLRTFLSLFGITVGIFCIIGVLATVDSLERNVQNDIKALGSNTIYVDKWDYSGQIPWWKLVNRPVAKFEEVKMLKQRSSLSGNVAFNINTTSKLEWGDEAVTGVNIYGITEDFSHIQKLDIELGRFLQQSDFDYGANNMVIGYSIAEKLFTRPEKAVGQEVVLYGRRANVIGLIKKQGKSLIGGWDFDECVLLSYSFMKSMVREDRSQPVLLVQGKDNIPMKALRDDVQGAMRSIRKLRPTQSDNFSMNDIEAFGEFAHSIFSGINKGGWAIAILSLVVGMFGVANIMFVTVRERTGQIGLKKAIGAKRYSIMMEFLLESAFLCIMGGLIGLMLVFVLTKIFSASFGFPIFISVGILTLAISICIITGVLAGIIPAFIAARMDPVVAIRSN